MGEPERPATRTEGSDMALVMLDANTIGDRDTVRVVPLRTVDRITMWSDPDEPGGVAVLVEVGDESIAGLLATTFAMPVAEAFRAGWGWTLCMIAARRFGVATGLPPHGGTESEQPGPAGASPDRDGQHEENT